MSNPRRSKKGKRSKNPFRKYAKAKNRRRNPFMKYPRRRRSNPRGLGGVKSFAVEGGKAIISGAVGSVAVRAAVQGVLGDKNVGMMGYAANLLAALGGGYALWKFTRSYAIALGFAVGGAASTVQRIWSEKVAMTSPAAAAPQLGDLDYSSNGMGGVGLSGYVDTSFALPSVTGPDGRVQAPFQPQLPAVSAAAGSTAPKSGVPVMRLQKRF